MPTLERGCTRPLLPRTRTRQPERPAPNREGSSSSDRLTPRRIEEAACVPGGFPEGAGPGGVGGQTGPRGCALRAHVEKSVAVRLYIVPPAPRSPWSTKIRKSTAGSPSSRRTWPASAAALPPARSRPTKRRRQPSRSVKESVVAVCRRARRASRRETADPSWSPPPRHRCAQRPARAGASFDSSAGNSACSSRSVTIP
jgi:hypothetical protein